MIDCRKLGQYGLQRVSNSMTFIPSFVENGHPAKTYYYETQTAGYLKSSALQKRKKKIEEREVQDDINEGSKKTGEIKQEIEGKKKYTKRREMKNNQTQ